MLPVTECKRTFIQPLETRIDVWFFFTNEGDPRILSKLVVRSEILISYKIWLFLWIYDRQSASKIILTSNLSSRKGNRPIVYSVTRFLKLGPLRWTFSILWIVRMDILNDHKQYNANKTNHFLMDSIVCYLRIPLFLLFLLCSMQLNKQRKNVPFQRCV